MAHFSPDLMAQFSTETLNMSIGPAHVGRAPKMRKWYRWQGTHSAWVQFYRACAADSSPAGRSLARNIADLAVWHKSWAALEGQTPDAFLESGVSTAAHREFSRAVAKLHADRLQPGTLRPMVAGGAWVVPLVLAGNPMPSRIRERTKLPPKNIELGVTLMAMTDWRALTKSLAPIAHAAWAYIQAGGVVTLTVNYSWAFHKSQDGHEGVTISLKAPLTSEAGFASCISTQASRCWALLMGQSLSGVPNGADSMPLAYWHRPNLPLLDGHGDGDAAVVKVLGIT